MSPRSWKCSLHVACSSLTSRGSTTVGRPRRLFRRWPPENWSVLTKRARASVRDILNSLSVKGYCARWARGGGGLARKLCEHTHDDEGYLCPCTRRNGPDRTEHEQLLDIAQRRDARSRENVEGRSREGVTVSRAYKFNFLFSSSRTTRSASSRDGSPRVPARTCPFSNRRPTKLPPSRRVTLPQRSCRGCSGCGQRSACRTRP
jgi:hypothetical protein